MNVKNPKTATHEQMVMTVSKNSMLVNIGLSIIKVLAGLIAHSTAMISDGIHSASDVFSTVVVMIGYKLSTKESDEDHPYGHERLECVAALLLAMILFLTGLGIGYSGYQKILLWETTLVAPGTLALVAAIISILVKEGMYWYTRRTALIVNSGAMMADAWHHRSDALSSVGSLVGILGARMGYPICDPLASLIICIFILKAAFDIAKDAILKMTDVACDKETVSKIEHIVLGCDGVLAVDSLQTRLFGAKIYIDVEIAAAANITLAEAHEIAENVHNTIERSFEHAKHCMVHVNPYLD
ncbi:cation diffusion facilitator family transporter [Chakrabartyella piscis]|uniref:cation diffusion facilitator family transporter n=1 Tax=Chakrabartyella piscis TaxID=2918914 RepID=UPI002958491A|nr:cation diffusion facilitator family transporter [Chakrabartyella piscis]